ncbi:MAG: hypothetical protein LC107_12965 [Chitinophagales bacterium]|nr:hypothetical protein [Chitinophagales bacterium]
MEGKDKFICGVDRNKIEILHVLYDKRIIQSEERIGNFTQSMQEGL